MVQQNGPKGRAVRVAAVGDSITYGHGARIGYPERLQELLGENYEVGNFGVSGSTMLQTGDLPYRSCPEYAASLAFEPDIVVIMLGTNDSKPRNWAHRDEFLSDYIAMIRSYQSLESRPSVYVNRSPKVYGEGNFSITDPVLIGEVIPLAERAAAETGARVIDVYGATCGKPEQFPDLVHPNDEGARTIAEAVFQGLKQLDLPL